MTCNVVFNYIFFFHFPKIHDPLEKVCQKIPRKIYFYDEYGVLRTIRVSVHVYF